MTDWHGTAAKRFAALAALAVVSATGAVRAEEAATVEARAAPHLNEGEEREHRLHIAVDTAFTYGIGGQSALGALARATGYTAVWNTRRATGTVDLGLQLAYQNEPIALAPWIDGDNVTGAGHHINVALALGHTIHMGQRRRASLGLLIFGGWSHWVSSYSLVYPREGITGSETVRHDDFIAGGELEFRYRFSRYVGMNVVAGAPFPTQSSYVIGMFYVGVGLTVFAR
jgi:hypothetical protein